MAFLSATAIIVTLLNTLILAAVFVGIIVLEVWLSRRKSRWPGLIMPAITLGVVAADGIQLRGIFAGRRDIRNAGRR